jgi:ferritin
MLADKMMKALNEQINEEFYSSYLYLAMAEYFREQKLEGFAKWLHVQAQEEWSHGMKILNYINEHNGRVVLQGIKEPPKDWKGSEAAIHEVMKHEQHITGCVNKLATMAQEMKDHATYGLMTWFVNEQVEEEGNVQKILDYMELMAKHPAGMFMIDREMAKRGEK